MKTSWYCHVNLKPQGPFAEEEMRLKIHKGQVGLHDLISRVDVGSWKPVHEWGTFELSLFPAAQSYVPGVAFDQTSRDWVILTDVKGEQPLQEGPFTLMEIRERLQERKVSPYQHVWKSGLSGWCQIKDRPEFYEFISSDILSSETL